MKKFAAFIITVLAVSVPAFGAPVQSSDEYRHCSAKSLSGPYGARFEGTTPFAFLTVGVTTFDGQGRFTATEVINVGGVSMPSAFGGTYTVNADCSGTMRATFDNGLTGNLYFVIVHGGEDVQAMFTDAGTTASGTFARQ